jgi:sterol 24-C-methyltransferase
MAPAKIETLELENHTRDKEFAKAMHQQSSKKDTAFAAMISKDKVAQKAAVDEYFKHWDNKSAATETDADRAV